MRLAALQMCSTMHADENLQVIARGCEAAKIQGADYVQLPEMAVMFGEDFEQVRTFATGGKCKQALDFVANLSAQYKLYIHLGSLAVPAAHDKCFNRSVLFDPNGERVATYDKIHLFDAHVEGDKPYRESERYEAGRHAVVADMGMLRLGLSVCYDVRFAQLYRTYYEAGAQILAVPAAFTVPTGKAHWETLMRARAIETGSYVVAAAQGGHHANGRFTYGHSMIVDPMGRILAQAQSGVLHMGFELIFADFDADILALTRKSLPALANSRVFSLSVNHNAAE